MARFHIADFLISEDGPTFIIAEISANHRQSLSLAKETIAAAADAGVE